MKYAIIGLGFIYPRHEKSIKETGGEVILTCDNDPSKGADYLDWKEMFKSDKFIKEVDTVSICTPNYLHREMAAEALRLGKKVLCEKPLSTTGYDGLEGVKTVLQLRNHPKLQNLQSQRVDVTAKMFRDMPYWDGWKGDNSRSGGILYNLGIHYIDLLCFLLGDVQEIIDCNVTRRLATGLVRFKNGLGSFHIEIVNNRRDQNRSILVDDVEINLSNQDNLSYEDLHTEVYKHFIKGEGVTLEEAKKSLQLVSDLLKYSGQNN